MFSSLRTRFGIPGVISVIALVFAMFGGAYAASNSSGGGKATASAKAKQGPRGKTGKTGPAGPAGPAGPTGPTGPAGAKGAAGSNGTAGTNGTNGTNGAPGTSVTSTEFVSTEEGHCTVGGSKFVAGSSKTYACNGKDGETGFTETLPSGKTETGSFSLTVSTGKFNEEAEKSFGAGAISFAIPLTEELDGNHVHIIGLGATGDASSCDEGTSKEPKAAPGNLCVYVGFEFFDQHNSLTAIFRSGFPGAGASPTGAVALAEGKPGDVIGGTFAVTAEEEAETAP